MRSSAHLFILALVGCDSGPPVSDVDCPPAHVRDARGTCLFSEAAVAEIMRTFDQGELVKINAEPFPQVTDTEVLRNVWITPLPAFGGVSTVELYRLLDPTGPEVELPVAFPVGTVIVHERVDGLEGSTVQVRRGGGYANDGDGPWWFGKFYPDGTPDVADCLPCAVCHNIEGKPSSEGLWGVPAEAREDGPADLP